MKKKYQYVRYSNSSTEREIDSIKCSQKKRGAGWKPQEAGWLSPEKPGKNQNRVTSARVPSHQAETNVFLILWEIISREVRAIFPNKHKNEVPTALILTQTLIHVNQ